MTDPDLAKVRVWLLCRVCAAECAIDVPRIALHRGKLSVKMHCPICDRPRFHNLNPLKLPAEDA